MRATKPFHILRAAPKPRPHQRTFTTSRQRAQEVQIIEVGPRDGLQNEKNAIPVATKIELVRRLAKTGVPVIEAGSFVSPKWVPQMANSADILTDILHSTPQSPKPILYQWLLPNMKGLDTFLSAYKPPTPTPSADTDTGPALNTSSSDANAMPSSTSGTHAMFQNLKPTSDTDTGPSLNTSSSNANAPTNPTKDPHLSTFPPSHEISLFTAATETFSRKNTNCSISDALQRFAPLISRARASNISVRAYVSVALGCPYEGPDVSPQRVAEITASLLAMGAREVSVADTTGMGTVPRTRALLKALEAAGVRISEDIALHFHDTFGQALPNILAGLDAGVRRFDAAVAGLGGCPYSPGATGNVATEDVVHMLEGLGVRTGVDLEMLSETGDWICGEVGRANESRAGKAVLARKRRAKL